MRSNPWDEEEEDLPRYERAPDRRESALGQLIDEVFGGRGILGQLREAADRTSETRQRLDRNMQTLLSVLNVPSRADYEKLVARIDTLQGNLVNVNMKLDRLIATQREQPAAPPPPRDPPAPAAKKKAARRTTTRQRVQKSTRRRS